MADALTGSGEFAEQVALLRKMAATKQVILFYHWTMESLAKQVVADPVYAGRVRLGRCSWDSFPDQTPSIQISPDDCLSMVS